MSTVAEIASAIRELSPAEREELEAILADEADADFERKFAADVAAGKLDRLSEEALREHRDGRTTEL